MVKTRSVAHDAVDLKTAGRKVNASTTNMTGSMNSPMFQRPSTASRMWRLTGPLSRAGSADSSPDNSAARCLARANRLVSRDWPAAALRSLGTRGRLRAASCSRRDGVGRFLAPGRSAYATSDGAPFSGVFLRPNTEPTVCRVTGCPRIARRLHGQETAWARVGTLAGVTYDVLTPDLDPARRSALRTRVTELLPTLRQDLEALTRIPSVSLAAFDQAQVEASAEAVAELLRTEGLEVEIIREGGRPAVLGHVDGPEGAPTVMLYAHHDVQPPGAESDWDSAPFEPTERDGRVYARGIADDKAGVMAHIAALRAHSGAMPVGVTVFVEGEEEIGSDSLGTILERHGEKLRADVIVLADSTNWAVGKPALTTTLRGLVRVVLTVRTLDPGIHSGMFGGAVPDAITAMIRMLATLHDAEGNVAVAGLKSGVASDLAYPEQRLREESGLLDGVELIGTGSILTRMWAKPSITTIGIDAPSVATSSNT